MTAFGITLAKEAAKSALSGASNALGTTIQDYLQRGLDKTFGIDRKAEQLAQQEKLNNLQIRGQIALMNEQLKNEKEMFDYSNPSKRIQQLQNAGLSIGLMYGGSGAGGSTYGNAASGNVSGATASDEAAMLSVLNEQRQLALQNSRLQSEIEVNKTIAEKNKAEAEKAQAETEKTSGIDTEEAQSRINQINANIEVLKADEALKNSQNELNKLQQISTKIANEFNEENNLELLKQSTSLSKKLLAEAQVSEQSVDTILATLKTNLSNLLMDIAYKKSNIELNDANIKNILNNITISNKKITIDENKLTNDWNIAVLNNKSGKIVQDVKGVTDALIKTLRWIGIEVKEDKDFDYQNIKETK